jgi:ParB-like chromosome segregation protein Spo0J
MAHRLDEVGRRSALEEGWLLDELLSRHGLAQQELGTRLSRSRSWVSRRLSLVLVLPEVAQHAVRDGHLPAQAAMYLVPSSRDKRAHPRQFLRAEETTRPDAKSDTELLIADLNAVSGLCFRARRRLTDGVVDRSRRRRSRGH